MKLQILESISAEWRKPNEDTCGSTMTSAWVMDGSTSRGSDRILPASSDSYWLVQVCQEFLKKMIDPELSSSDFFSKLYAHLISKFQQESLIPDFIPIEHPTACISMIRAATKDLELINLGDCKMLYRLNHEDIHSFGTSNIPDLDRKVIGEMIRLRNIQTISYADLWPYLTEVIKENRKKLNRSGGYWALDLTPRWLEKLETLKIPLDKFKKGDFLLMTDGFYRLVDTVKLYNENELFENATTIGLKPLLKKLREMENGDLECWQFPRIKPFDDVTAVLLHIEK